MKKSVIVIPARLDSQRLSDKMLLDKTGLPLIIETWRNANKAKEICPKYIADVVVTTDNNIIANECGKHDIKVFQGGRCESGTERVLKCMYSLDHWYKRDSYNIINMQGDYPCIDPNELVKIAQALYFVNDRIHTLFYTQPNIEKWRHEKYVKVVTTYHGDAMYFSREPVPHKCQDLKIHLGVYGFPWLIADQLRQIYEHTVLPHNYSECLEQILWLERGFHVLCHKSQETLGIDTKDDYEQFVKNHDAS